MLNLVITLNGSKAAISEVVVAYFGATFIGKSVPCTHSFGSDGFDDVLTCWHAGEPIPLPFHFPSNPQKLLTAGVISAVMQVRDNELPYKVISEDV